MQRAEVQHHHGDPAGNLACSEHIEHLDRFASTDGTGALRVELVGCHEGARHVLIDVGLDGRAELLLVEQHDGACRARSIVVVEQHERTGRGRRQEVRRLSCRKKGPAHAGPFVVR
ncbi:MAG TPA: hypothetical protein VFB54_20410 [Burkholderiales bacterium]|nr:hypothetical protein [Burkholderiales bacterium]